MTRIAIVEDDALSAKLLFSYIKKYEQETNGEFEAIIFENGYKFLENYKSGAYEIIFMDINMPHLSGIETAIDLRKLDESVALIFVTNLAQYAINGYEVSALDFMLKPVSYC